MDSWWWWFLFLNLILSYLIFSIKDEPTASKGFIFYSDTKFSQKSQDLNFNNKCSLLFHWPTLERQVSIVGIASPISRDTVKAYWDTRPWASKIAACVSHQSTHITKEHFDKSIAEMKLKYPEESSSTIPLPDHWGGYSVNDIRSFEFWQGGPGRIHDRILLTKEGGPETKFHLQRLSP